MPDPEEPGVFACPLERVRSLTFELMRHVDRIGVARRASDRIPPTPRFSIPFGIIVRGPHTVTWAPTAFKPQMFERARGCARSPTIVMAAAKSPSRHGV